MTFIWFLPCVCSMVLGEGWLFTEGFPTFLTFIRFLPCMNSLMFNEIWILVETFPTFMTFIGFLPCVGSLMSCVGWFLVECFSTFIGFFPCVYALLCTKDYGSTFIIFNYIVNWVGRLNWSQVWLLARRVNTMFKENGVLKEIFSTFIKFVVILFWMCSLSNERWNITGFSVFSVFTGVLSCVGFLSLTKSEFAWKAFLHSLYSKGCSKIWIFWCWTETSLRQRPFSFLLYS